MATDKRDPVYIYAWPKGKPFPESARDGCWDLIEGDEEFEYSPQARYRLPDVDPQK